MTTIEWADFIRPIIIGFGIALLVQFTKDAVQKAITIATTGYTVLICLVIAAVWGLICGWTWPGIFFSAAISFAGTQLFYLFGRGILK